MKQLKPLFRIKSARKKSEQDNIDECVDAFFDDQVDTDDTPPSSPSDLEEFLNSITQRFLEEQDLIGKHREPILKWFLNAASVQLAIVNVLLIICLVCFKEQLAVILDFFKYFIASTFIEILGGLLIIVRFLFNDNLYNIVHKIFDKSHKNKDK